MTHKHERSISRRTAVQVLYAAEVNCKSPDKLIKECSLDVLQAPLNDYAMCLIDGVVAHKQKIDEILSSISQNWAIERMPIVDLNIIRVAIFEILHVDDVPVSVAIDEAVELAKGFGGDDSHKFVNGILGAFVDERNL